LYVVDNFRFFEKILRKICINVVYFVVAISHSAAIGGFKHRTLQKEDDLINFFSCSDPSP